MLLINRFPRVTKLSSRTECVIAQNTYIFCAMSRQVQTDYAKYTHTHTRKVVRLNPFGEIKYNHTPSFNV